MGKRYYCDYCDKSFADNPTNRRLHMTGGIHQRNKKAHYEAVRDEQDILRDDVQKKPCRSYMSTGDCRFGDRCQYSHLTDADKAKLAKSIRQREVAKDKRKVQEQKKLEKLSGALPEWMAKRSKRLEAAHEDQQSSSSKTEQIIVPKYELADCLRAFPSLPPSLIPPTRYDILNATYPEWG